MGEDTGERTPQYKKPTEALSQKQFNITELSGGNVRIEGRNSKLTILYGQHDSPTPIEDFPGHLDRIFLEFNIDYVNNFQRTLDKAAGVEQYEPVFRRIQKTGERLGFIDVDILEQVTHLFLLGILLEGLTGTLLMRQVGAWAINKQARRDLSRRDFLKIGVAAGTTAWLYSSLMPAATLVIEHKTLKEAVKLSEKIHPEVNLALITYRNAVIAEKLRFGMDKGLWHDNGLIIGKGHVGIEPAYIASSEERLEFLSRFHELVPPDKVVRSLPTFYTIATTQLRKNGYSREFIEVPQLKKIVT